MRGASDRRTRYTSSQPITIAAMTAMIAGIEPATTSETNRTEFERVRCEVRNLQRPQPKRLKISVSVTTRVQPVDTLYSLRLS